MVFSEIRIRKGNPAFGNCKYCGAPGNHCYDYCPRFNDETEPIPETEYGDLELTPYEQPYRLENWHPDDLVMYVGGIYAKEAYSR